MLEHLPILQVVVPLLAAPACLILGDRRLAWLFTVLSTAASMLISWTLLYQVHQGGAISYDLGGWEAPWGIEYRIDILSAWMLFIVSTIGFVVMLAAEKGIEREIPAENHIRFYVLYLLCLAGLLGIVATGDIFNVFVFLEISSLATYALIACGKDRRALWASYQYLIVGTIGATFILIGIGLIYSMTGTLNMVDAHAKITQIEATRTLSTAFAFIVVGICLKLALFPLHLWLPNAYAFAPGIVTAFLAATATKVAVYLLIRFYLSVFGPEFSIATLPLHTIFLVLGIAGIFVASLVAIYQTDVKRLFAYSSIAQVGYMAIGIGMGTTLALQGTLLHVFNHALMKGALFLALTALVYRLGSPSMEKFKGLGRQMPWTMAAIVVAGLSLIGVPLTAGFVSKWYLVMAAIQGGMWPIAILIVLGSILAIVYIWRIVEQAYFGAGEAEGVGNAPRYEAPLPLLATTWILVVSNVYFGIDTRLTVHISGAAARYIMGEPS